MDRKAFYFHASSYKFEQEARDAVIVEFSAIISNTSVRCFYDTKSDMFCVECPTSLGQNADDVLGTTISEYIARELAESDREDRPPRVQRFSDDVSAEIEEPAMSTLPEPTSYSLGQQRVEQVIPLVFHVIASETPPSSSLTFFKLRDLGEGMLERTLVAKDGKSRKVVEANRSCRIARWSTSHKQYVFNGRMGNPSAVSTDVPENEVLSLSTFTVIDGSKGGRYEEKSLPVVQHWEFRGDRPRPQQWLEGMGDVVLVDPNIKSEPPKDALKFQKKGTLQKPDLGRMRIPKEIPSASNDLDSNTSDSEDETAVKAKSFGQLLLKGHRDHNADVESDSDTDASDDATFKKILGQAKDGQATTVSAPPETGEPPSSIQSVWRPSAPIPTTPSLQNVNVSRTGQNEYFPEHGRFAKVDNVGLTSNAAHQAEWEHSNPRPRKSKANRSGVGYRTTTTASSDDVISQSTAPTAALSCSPPTEVSSSPQAAKSLVLSNHGVANADIMPWTNKVVRPSVPVGHLIDDKASFTMAPIKRPPGLPKQDKSQLNSDQLDPDTGRRNQESTQPTLSYDHAPTQPLIDLTENDTENKAPEVRRPTMGLLTPSIPPNRATRPASAHNEDQILERLQQRTDASDNKKYTMRQKAGKKGRSSHASVRKQANPAIPVNLPKPDPPPPPKKSIKGPQSETQQPATKQTTTQQSVTPQPTAQRNAVPQSNSDVTSRLQVPRSYASDASVSERAKSVDSSNSEGEQDNNSQPAQLAAGIAKAVQMLSAEHDLTGATMRVQFGLLMSKHTSDREFLNAVHESKKMQSRMQAEASALHTELLPRITTSDNDARFLLSLVERDDVRAQVEYEVYLKTSNGKPRLLKFEQSAIDDFMVFQPDTILAEIYMHYPMRVRDAKCSIIKVEADSEMMQTIGDFVRSIQTIEWAPSFLASVPSHSFSIEKVNAKRVFSKTLSGVDLRLTQVQELALSSIDKDDFNFKASAYLPDAMIQNHTMWWECSIHADSADMESAEQLQSLGDEIVNKIDDIGYENHGPFQKEEIHQPEESVLTVPFW